MKKIIIHALFNFTMLFALIVVFGVASSSSVHAATASGSQVSTSVIPNINRTPCNGRTDFFEVFNNTGTLCFANAGYTTVYIDKIYKVCSGNNAGYFIDNVGNIYLFGKNICSQTFEIRRIGLQPVLASPYTSCTDCSKDWEFPPMQPSLHPLVALLFRGSG